MTIEAFALACFCKEPFDLSSAKTLPSFQLLDAIRELGVHRDNNTRIFGEHRPSIRDVMAYAAPPLGGFRLVFGRCQLCAGHCECTLGFIFFRPNSNGCSPDRVQYVCQSSLHRIRGRWNSTSDFRKEGSSCAFKSPGGKSRQGGATAHITGKLNCQDTYEFRCFDETRKLVFDALFLSHYNIDPVLIFDREPSDDRTSYGRNYRQYRRYDGAGKPRPSVTDPAHLSQLSNCGRPTRNNKPKDAHREKYRQRQPQRNLKFTHVSKFAPAASPCRE